MHTIKPLHCATSADVRALAHAAAERGELLDTANVFPIGTNQHAVFTSEYLARTFELEDCADILVLDLPCHPAGQRVYDLNPGVN